MTKGHFCTNDVASLWYGCRLFRPESHWSSGPDEVQIFGVSFCLNAFETVAALPTFPLPLLFVRSPNYRVFGLDTLVPHD
jgi:hypothetical protein